MSYHTTFSAASPVRSIDPTLLSLSPKPSPLSSHGMRIGPRIGLRIDLDDHDTTAESTHQQSSPPPPVATQSAFPSPSARALDYEVKNCDHSQPPEHIPLQSPQPQCRQFQSPHAEYSSPAAKHRRYAKQFYRSFHFVSRSAPTSAPCAGLVSPRLLSEKLDYIPHSEALKKLSFSENQALDRPLSVQQFSHTSLSLNLQERLTNLQQL